MTLSDLLASVVEWVRDLSPIRIVRTWEQGALMRGGAVRGGPLTSENGLGETGIHFCIPLLDDVYVQDASEEVIETALQSCTTADGKQVSFQFVVRYRVTDVTLLLKTVYEVSGTVANMIEGAAGEMIQEFTFNEAMADLAASVCSDVSGALEKRGIQLEEVCTRTFVECQTLRLLNDNAVEV